MTEEYLRVIGFTFPFFMNALGAMMIFFTPNKKDSGIFLGISAGIMTAACIFSLIIPAVELSSHLGGLAFLPACVGLFVGAIFIYFSEKLLRKQGENRKLSQLFWAVTLHNLPEGLAVGFAFGSGGLGLISALSVSFGIGVQNFPEGLAIALAYNRSGKGKLKSFSYGVISGIVEPVSALIGALLVVWLSFLQPWILAFAGGCMIFVIVEQLIPDSVHSRGGVWGFIIGFCIMMALDLALG